MFDFFKSSANKHLIFNARAMNLFDTFIAQVNELSPPNKTEAEFIRHLITVVEALKNINQNEVIRRLLAVNIDTYRNDVNNIMIEEKHDDEGLAKKKWIFNQLKELGIRRLIKSVDLISTINELKASAQIVCKYYGQNPLILRTTTDFRKEISTLFSEHVIYQFQQDDFLIPRDSFAFHVLFEGFLGQPSPFNTFLEETKRNIPSPTSIAITNLDTGEEVDEDDQELSVMTFDKQESESTTPRP